MSGDFLSAMKDVALKAVEANAPAAFLFGVVTAAVPLTVLVDNRFSITGEMMVVPREFRAGAYLTHTHGIQPHTHSLPAGESGETALVTATEQYFGLAVGERVILLRNAGGQQFLILGRL